MKNNQDSGASGESAEVLPPLQLEPSKADRKRCQGVTKSGAACTAWATKGGLCYFHANPDKAAELGRNGGLRNRHVYDQPSELVAPPESAAEVRRMLSETMAEVRAGRMDPKVANTVAYVGTALLRAYEADAANTADTPVQPYVPLVYRTLTRHQEPTEIYDYQTGKLITPEPPALPAPVSPTTPTVIGRQDKEIEVLILDY